MVYYIRSRRGYEDFLRSAVAPESSIWIDYKVLEQEEINDLRQSGFKVTNFTTRPRDEPNVSTISEHHPGEVIWVEF
jgi:hypothetical protein